MQAQVQADRLGNIGRIVRRVYHKHQGVAKPLTMADLPIDLADLPGIIETICGKVKAANHHDAEEAVSVALLEWTEKGDDLDLDPSRSANGALVTRAVWRLKTAMTRREAGNLSLDAFAEEDASKAAIEVAVDVVDFDSHATLAIARRHPVIDLKLSLAESGAQPWLVKRGSANNFGRYPDEVVERARSLRAKPMTYAAVSEKMGVPPATIRAWCKGRSRTQPSTPGWTREVAIEAIRHFAREEGRRPVELDVKSDKRLPTIKTIRRLFGCWSAALKAAGMCGEPPQQWTRAAALDAFRRAAKRLGRWPSHKDLRVPGNGLPGNAALQRLFGTTSLKRIRALAVGDS